MTTAFDKAKISAFTALFGSITAIVSGYANYTLFVVLATFFFTMMIQYGLIRVKILVPFAAFLAFLYWSISHHGGLS